MFKKHVGFCRGNGADQGFEYRVDVCKRDDPDRSKTFEGHVGYEILQRVYNPADAKRSCVSLRGGYPELFWPATMPYCHPLH